MFSDEAAQRHFPICKRNAESSKLMVVRDSSTRAKKAAAAQGRTAAPKLR
eukprot:CAMPEP_0170452114 /NCGR_PEP_ID=MMETSP0123-20130129/1127_1 /TAXON_ID=182087 /ORGANISM="Favella ehrenbergii, Strain Fehren 1" /LENGTH=49 /DNA_ID= /DNA_START= /DNA_END= /DNA_ORIENTATION=